MKTKGKHSAEKTRRFIPLPERVPRWRHAIITNCLICLDVCQQDHATRKLNFIKLGEVVHGPGKDFSVYVRITFF